MIVHLVRADWFHKFADNSTYESETLHDEGFVHCSAPHQVGEIRERYFQGIKNLVVLVIDPYKVKAVLKYEPGFGGALFPHIYGPINKDAIGQILYLED